MFYGDPHRPDLYTPAPPKKRHRPTRRQLKIGALAGALILLVSASMVSGYNAGTSTRTKTIDHSTTFSTTLRQTTTETSTTISTNTTTLVKTDMLPIDPPATVQLIGWVGTSQPGGRLVSLVFKTDHGAASIPATVGSGGGYSATLQNKAIYEVVITYTDILGATHTCDPNPRFELFTFIPGETFDFYC